MENKTARPVGSHHRATKANINQPVAAAKRLKPWERSLYPRAAPIGALPKDTHTTAGSNVPAPGLSRRPTSSAPVHYRPGPASRPAHNSSSLKGVSGTGGAAPFDARPSMRGRAVRDVGFENWAFRHESIMAHPVRAPRGRPSRIPSAILEEDEESDVLPALPSPSPLLLKTSDVQVRWQGDRARRSPAVVHAGAAPVRSHAASLVAATESPAARHSWPKRAPRPAVLPSSPLRHSIAHAPEDPPRTYLDMHARYERAPTRLMRMSPGALDWGENFSPCSAGTTVRDIRRRAGLGLKVPLPGNAVGQRRVFVAPFVDAPTVIGGRREMRGVERELERRREEAAGSEVVPAPLEGEKEERKKGWQRVSAFLARKMSRKAKGTASPPSSPDASPATPSPRTPTTPPSLVSGGSSSNASPAPAPATPTQVRFATPVVISAPPNSIPREATAEKKKQPVSPPSPLKTALKRASPPCSQPQREHFARTITAASAQTPCRKHTSPPATGEAEEAEEEAEHSPLSDVSDADLFPSPLATSERWARPEELVQHEAVADALAEETAAADWAGALKQAERVRYVGKGKGKVVDVKARPARYRGRKMAVEAPVVGVVGERRDTLVEERGVGGWVPGAWSVVEELGSKRPVVAISGLHR